jgi:hypothetical protein
MKRKWTDNQLREAVASSLSIAQVLQHLDLAIAGGSYRIIKTHIERLNLDTSHFSGQSGLNRFGKSKNRTIDEILVLGSPYTSYEIRRIVLRLGLKTNQCEECGLAQWRDKPITIQVHHMNRIRNDHRLENLQMLCPNCHSQK